MDPINFSSCTISLHGGILFERLFPTYASEAIHLISESLGSAPWTQTPDSLEKGSLDLLTHSQYFVTVFGRVSDH